jgi:IS5 family transposase
MARSARPSVAVVRSGASWPRVPFRDLSATSGGRRHATTRLLPGAEWAKGTQCFHGVPGSDLARTHRYWLTMTVSTRDGERAARVPTGARRRCAAHAVQPLRPSGLIGGAMVRRTYPQRTFVEVLLPDSDKLWDPVLRQIDLVLEDEDLLDQVTAALARRHPLSARRGRLGTPAAVALRMLVLKHLYDWSFDECEREVRGGLVYRAFCRIDGERVPDAKTLIRLAHLLDGPVLKDLLERLATIARQRRVIHGRRLRVDTTVVETTIHYPTDSALLADGVRVLTRTMKRLTARLGPERSTCAIGRAAWPAGSLRSRTTPGRRRSGRVRTSGSAARPGCGKSTEACCGSRGASSGRRRSRNGSVASIARPPRTDSATGCAPRSAWCSEWWPRRRLGCCAATPTTRTKCSASSNPTPKPSARARRRSRPSSASS